MNTLRAITIALSMALASAPALIAQTIAIRGGTVHTLAGDDIENGVVVMQDGIISAVGAAAAVPAGAEVIDASGLHVYPGLFDAGTRLGLTEIGAVDVTQDLRELGEFNPHLMGATAVHPASEIIPVTRANGITHAIAEPQANAGGVGGQASLIHLNGWTIEEMLIAPSVGAVVSWPTTQGGFRFGGFGRARSSYSERKKQHDEQVAQLGEWVEEAARYDQAVSSGADVDRDLRLEAFAAVVRGDLPLLVNVDREQDIRDAVAFAVEHDLSIVILGGDEAWLAADVLAANHVPVILGPTQSLPTQEDHGYDERYAQPGQLYAAGVKFAFATFDASSSRTLPYEAANAVSYGLPWEEAIRAVTINGAEIFGVGDKLGTIETGKIANLIVTDGDPLEITTQVKDLIINGDIVSLDNKHLELYEKYRARPTKH
jgi:imidazolonepropionase-like amidohydrolase